MKNYGIVRSDKKPSLLELTETNVFIATDIKQVEVSSNSLDDELSTNLEYEYNLIGYTKDEYIFLLHEEQEQQNEVLDYLLMEV